MPARHVALLKAMFDLTDTLGFIVFLAGCHSGFLHPHGEETENSSAGTQRLVSSYLRRREGPSNIFNSLQL